MHERTVFPDRWGRSGWKWDFRLWFVDLFKGPQDRFVRIDRLCHVIVGAK